MFIDLNCFLRWAMWPMGLLFDRYHLHITCFVKWIYYSLVTFIFPSCSLYTIKHVIYITPQKVVCYEINSRFLINKRPMGHIAHLRKQFKSINTYDYIITLIKRRLETWKAWESTRPVTITFISNWPSGSVEEDF